jgi:hypothetical protein
VASLGDCAQPHRHFLDVIRNGAQQNEKPNEVEAILRPGYRIGSDAPRIVVGNHHNNAWTRDHQKQFDGLPLPLVSVIKPRKNVHNDLLKVESSRVASSLC